MLQPIQLQTEQRTGEVEVQVIGHSPVDVAASYQLEVSNGASGNRSTQHGVVRLAVGQRSTLIRLRLNSDGTDALSVRLVVELEGGRTYEQRSTRGPDVS
jgi:hypothetical protein